jgi:hypothetical protein
MNDLRRLERACALVGAVLIVSGLLHLLVFAVAGGPWEGPVSWRKAVTFGVSFGLTVLTLAPVSRPVRMSGRVRGAVVGGFVAACVVEVALVTMQAWRHVPSHFNRETAFDSAVSTVLAAGGAVIVGTSVALTVLAFRRRPALSDSLVLGLRAGLLVFLVALGVGVAMIASGVRLGITDGATAAYDGAGALKPAHAVPMHAVLVLPLIAWLFSFHDRPEAWRVRWTAAACAGYSLATVVTLLEVVSAVDPLAPGVPAGAASALGIGTVGVVGLYALAGAVSAARSPARSPSRRAS